MERPNMRAVYDARNRVIARLYLEREWRISEIAEAFEMSVSNVWRILQRLDATLPDKKRRKRIAETNRAKWQDPDYRAKIVAATRLAWVNGKMRGRPKVYANDPSKRREYQNLQRKVGAVEARQMMEAA